MSTLTVISMNIYGPYKCRTATVTTIQCVQRGVFQLEVFIAVHKTRSKLPPNEIDGYVFFTTLIRFLRTKSIAETLYALVSEGFSNSCVALGAKDRISYLIDKVDNTNADTAVSYHLCHMIQCRLGNLLVLAV